MIGETVEETVVLTLKYMFINIIKPTYIIAVILLLCAFAVSATPVSLAETSSGEVAVDVTAVATDQTVTTDTSSAVPVSTESSETTVESPVVTSDTETIVSTESTPMPEPTPASTRAPWGFPP